MRATRVSRGQVETRLEAAVASAPGRLGVAVRGDDGWVWARDADRVVRSASTIKVPILLAVLALVEQGRLDLAAPVRLPPVADRVGGGGALVLLPSVTELPLLETLRLMVALSDNDAANAVLDHTGLLDIGGVDDLLERVPTRHTRLRRRLMDLDAAARGLDNETSAADLCGVLAALREGRLLGEAMTRIALETMRTQQDRAGLPAYLTADVEVAAKAGDLPGLRADMALLERAGRWVAVAVVADGVEEGGTDRATQVLPVFATVGELVATHLPEAGEGPVSANDARSGPAG